MKNQSKKQYSVTPKEFISAWESSETVEEAAQKLGMPKDIVVARAANYRKKKIKLKKMGKPGRVPLNVSELNAYIEQLRSGSAQKKKMSG